MKGALRAEGCGVFLRKIPQASEPVAVKIYPDHCWSLNGYGRGGAAAATGRAEILREVPVEPGRGPSRPIRGGRFPGRNGPPLRDPAECNRHRRQPFTPPNHQSTIADGTITRSVCYVGYFYEGEVQGLVTPRHLVPIDTQAVRPLPPPSDRPLMPSSPKNAVAFRMKKMRCLRVPVGRFTRETLLLSNVERGRNQLWRRLNKKENQGRILMPRLKTCFGGRPQGNAEGAAAGMLCFTETGQASLIKFGQQLAEVSTGGFKPSWNPPSRPFRTGGGRLRGTDY